MCFLPSTTDEIDHQALSAEGLFRNTALSMSRIHTFKYPSPPRQPLRRQKKQAIATVQGDPSTGYRKMTASAEREARQRQPLCHRLLV